MKFNSTNRVIALVVLVLTAMSMACTRADVGEVLIETTSTGISRVIHPSNGWVGVGGPSTDHHEFDTKIWTFQLDVMSSTKDNAAVKVVIQARVVPPQSDADIISYVSKFGVKAEERNPRVGEFLSGVMNTETKNAVAEYEAYGLLANQEAIQKRLFEVLKAKLKEQGWLSLESIELMGRPDFVDDRIENAASAVVANQKAKEAAQADLERARVEAEKKEVEAKTFANPAMLELEKYRISNQAQVDIERARAEGMAKHNGTLTVVNGSAPQLQLGNKQ